MGPKINYSGVVLYPADRQVLLDTFPPPPGWEPIAHHMTINLGDLSQGPAANMLGKEATLQVVSFSQDERVMAVQVKTSVPSANAVKHITIAVNRSAGGKPFHSNQLQDWSAVQKALTLHGFVAECGPADIVIRPAGR